MQDLLYIDCLGASVGPIGFADVSREQLQQSSTSCGACIGGGGGLCRCEPVSGGFAESGHVRSPRWPLVGSGSGGAIDYGGASTYDRVCFFLFFFSFVFLFFFNSEAILVGPNVLSIIE